MFHSFCPYATPIKGFGFVPMCTFLSTPEVLHRKLKKHHHHQVVSPGIAPLKINMEHNHGGLEEICGFHVNLPGCIG